MGTGCFDRKMENVMIEEEAKRKKVEEVNSRINYLYNSIKLWSIFLTQLKSKISEDLDELKQLKEQLNKIVTEERNETVGEQFLHSEQDLESKV